MTFKEELEEKIIEACQDHLRHLLFTMRECLSETMFNKAMEIIAYEAKRARYF